MNFTSAEFLLFFPVVLLLFRFLPPNTRWMLLLAASWAFYMSYNPSTGILLILATTCSYLAGIRIEDCRKDKTAGFKMQLWTGVGIGVPLACLLVFKYAGFAADNVSALANAIGIHTAARLPRFVLPIGISFYTFQTLSYVIDVRRGTIPAERHFGLYALFVSFFPQLVAGPIERPGKLIPQLRRVCGMPFAECSVPGGSQSAFVSTGLPEAPRPRSSSERGDLANGLGLMLLGFFKKLVVADYLAQFAEPVYHDPSGATGFSVILAAFFFAIQIYCDFSGYSDIACGAARMLGVRLTENFRLPYSAGSLHEFWRRWHISLTSWLTDYIYIPLGGSRRGLARQLVNIMIVFAVSGLWHGADWSFVIWGLLHGAAMCLETMIFAGKTGGTTRKNETEYPAKAVAMLHRILTFAFVCFTWIFFRAEGLGDAFILIQRLFAGYGPHAFADTIAGMGMTGTAPVHIMLVLVCLALLEKMRSGGLAYIYPLAGKEESQESKALFIIIMVMTIAASWLMLLAEHAGNVFIYFRF